MAAHSNQSFASLMEAARKRIAKLRECRYHRIGDIAKLLEVETHVLRYWETQFSQVKPQKSGTGHRLYRRKDVEALVLIRELLYTERYTIVGAKRLLKESNLLKTLQGKSEVSVCLATTSAHLNPNTEINLEERSPKTMAESTDVESEANSRARLEKGNEGNPVIHHGLSMKEGFKRKTLGLDIATELQSMLDELRDVSMLLRANLT